MTKLARQKAHEPRSAQGGAVVRPSAFQLSDAALVAAIRTGQTDARGWLFDRYAKHLERVLARVLGAQDEVYDALHDVFVQAYRDLPKLREATALKAWLTGVAVNVARGRIRRARRRRWLRFLPPEKVPDVPAPHWDGEVSEALAATYLVLDAMPTEERIAFALRFIEGMKLTETAEACGVSLATIKRRLKNAEGSFMEHAADHACLVPWIQEGTRWRDSPS